MVLWLMVYAKHTGSKKPVVFWMQCWQKAVSRIMLFMMLLLMAFARLVSWKKAQEVFAKMSERGYSPNVYTYSSLIDRLFKDKRLDLALKVLSKMLESSCAPNVIIYTEMIDGLCKVGKTGEAYKLMLMMEEKGCKPNVVTYTAMIDGFGKAGKVDKSLELLQEMSSKGCAPNYITYRVLINHCCAVGLLDEAYQLLEEMKQTYWPRHLANYHKVIEGFSKEFMMSLELVDEMGKNDSAPLVPVYKVLINSFQKAGRLEMALVLHKEFSALPLVSPAHKNIYYSLIESLSISHKVDKAFELYNDMIGKEGNFLNSSVFVNLIKGLIRVNRWEDALLLSESLCYMDIRWLSNEYIQKGKSDRAFRSPTINPNTEKAAESATAGSRPKISLPNSTHDRI
ncbi:Tetratricopeptide repeat (TPR)-like superfamily protein [Abeliophyllum distichum]|uniref:Tetratricopeptide repeat (TPR)-like superfamily protein n=1 Tax=Abeliophyllum distichum TaxID=126358 RepID=A0ABD1RAF4_9LAMI